MSNMPVLLLDSLNAFWLVAERLQNGGAVAETEWHALFQTSAYRTLAAEFDPDTLRPRFQLAFDPGCEAEALAAAPGDGLLAHYLWVKEERDQIRSFVAHLDPERIIARVMQHCSPWLPPEATQGHLLPAVTLAIFDADARGYDTVVLDAGLALRLGEKGLDLLLAHEFHHWFRNRVEAVKPVRPENLAWVLDQIQMEGIADQINVPAFLNEGIATDDALPGWAEAYRSQVKQAPSFLLAMDQLLRQMAESPASATEHASHLRRLLPMAGHPIGYHMACRMVDAGLRDAMVATCARPVHFMRLYAEACERLGAACELSDSALHYLDLAPMVKVSTV